MSAAYRFHMAAEQFDGLDGAKMGTALEAALKVAGVNPDTLIKQD